MPILPQHEESRQRGISRNVEESGRNSFVLILQQVRRISSMTTGKQEVRTSNYFSRGIFLGYLVQDWARTSFGSGIRTHLTSYKREVRGSFFLCVEELFCTWRLGIRMCGFNGNFFLFIFIVDFLMFS